MKAKGSQSRFFYGWIVVAASLAIQTILYGAMYSYSVFFKHVASPEEGLDLTRTATSGVITVGAVVGGFLGIAAGRLSDRYGPRIVVPSFAFVAGLGYMLLSQVHSPLELYLFYGVLAAAGIAAGYSPILSTIPRWFEEKRGLALGIVVSGIGLGTMIILPLASHLISLYGWRTAYICIAIMIWVLVIPCSLLLRRNPEEMGLQAYGKSEVTQGKENNAIPEEGFTLRQALRTAPLWTLFFTFGLYAFGLGMVMFHLVAHATDVGIPEGTAALLMTIIGGASIAGRIAMGNVADRIGVRRAMVISLALLAISMFFLAGAWSILIFCLLCAIFGFGYGGMVPQMPASTGELFGMKALGAIFAVVALGATEGMSVGPVLAGYIYDVTESYRLAFSIGAAAIIVGIGLVFLLRRPRRDYGNK